MALNVYEYSGEKNELIAHMVRPCKTHKEKGWFTQVVYGLSSSRCVDGVWPYLTLDLYDFVRGIDGVNMYSAIQLKLEYWRVSLIPKTRPLMVFKTQKRLF